MRYAYDMLGNRIHQLSMEAGARWMLNDVAGKPIRAWDSRGHNFTTTYDALRRPVEQYVRGTQRPTATDSDPRTLNRDILVDRIEYGEPPPTPAAGTPSAALNLRTRIYRHFDSAGVATNARLDANGNPIEAYDFKGNLLRSTRRLVSDYTAIPDWQLNPRLDAETFEGSTRYDALNRPVQSVAPHSSLTGPAPEQVQRHPAGVQRGQPAGAGRRVAGTRRRARPACSTRPPTRRRRSASPTSTTTPRASAPRIDYKNGATHRRLRLRPADLPARSTSTPGGAWTLHRRLRRPAAASADHRRAGHAACRQGLRAAEPALHLRPGRQHHPHPGRRAADHLLPQPARRAEQRLHLRRPLPADPGHRPRAPGPERRRSTPSADRARTPSIRVPHAARPPRTTATPWAPTSSATCTTPSATSCRCSTAAATRRMPGWTRAYDYPEPSLIEDGSGDAPQDQQPPEPHDAEPERRATPQSETYQHDAHGNMVRMPHLGGGLPGPNMHWDYKDQLRADRPGRRRHGLLRLRRLGPARAQGVGEGAGPHRGAHLPRRLRDLPQARRPHRRRTRPRWSARRCT